MIHRTDRNIRSPLNRSITNQENLSSNQKQCR